MEENKDFVHLHVHSEYSLLDSSAKIKELISQSKNLNMKAIALTDHGNMFGVINFYREAKKQGIKPIIGCEIYVANKSLYEKQQDSYNYYSHLVVLAETEEGLSNLNKIVSKGYVDGYYYRPRVDVEFLREHSKGLIALSACLAGPLNRKLLKYSYKDAVEEAKIYSEIFSKNHNGEPCFYVELQNHGIKEQLETNPLLIKIAKELDLPLVATNDVHYVSEKDVEAHEVLLCINTGKTMFDDDRLVYEGGQFYLKNYDEMYELFSYVNEAIENTVVISNRCNVEITFGNYKLPKYDTPKEYTTLEYFRYLTTEGVKFHYGEMTESLQNRLDYEIDVISSMGFVDYFLIVWDFIKFAKTNGIAVGPGRGSAAGSIVSYALGITTVDPLKYNLLFERFLNPERVSMPDIDIDFCYERRREVIDYVIDKYGEDCVSQIITFGTLGARAVIRDTGRALGMTYQDVDRIAKMIPKTLGIDLTGALKVNPDLKEAYDTEDDTKRLIDMALKLEGLPRHSSTHAAGVLITDKPITEYVPLARNEGVITSQYTMGTLEELGLLKMDFLGLRTLTVIDNCVKLLKESGKVAQDFDIDKIDFDDPKVYELIAQGKTEGVFQLESSGMKSFMKELKANSLEDVIAGISLYRPGPMDFIPKYVKGKNTSGEIQYTDKALIPILNTTYGCIIYQEQVMEIFRVLAGYSLGRSDLVRRAMSKKKIDVMEQEREIFLNGDGKDISGCIANGVTKENGNKIFDEMAEFAKYAFNKSHAAGYAIVGYQTAWLKTYFKDEFMSTLMTSVMGSTQKIAEYIVECKAWNIKILTPCVNESFGDFVPTSEGIRFGLLAMKNVGRGLVKALIDEREKNGKFTSMTDFITRLESKELNKRALESLIHGGAFDSIGGKRSQYLFVYMNILSSVQNTRKKNIEGQLSLFGDDFIDDNITVGDGLPKIDEFENSLLLKNERAILGLYLSGHPLNDYIDIIEKKVTVTSKDLLYNEEEESLLDGKKCVVCGVISAITTKFTRNNAQMAFITIEDLYGEIEIIVFPKTFDEYRYLLREENPIIVEGTVNLKDEENGKVLSNKIISCDDAKSLYIYIDNKSDKRGIFNCIKANYGVSSVIIINRDTKENTLLEKKYNVNIRGDIKENLLEFVTKEDIEIK
ncbi:MAG: DNA polymerase III subunit alpha [Lachnospirales bacterium]